jgi:hypothetical protein
MKTVIIAYEVVSPVVIENAIDRMYEDCIVIFRDLDEDYFEVTILGNLDLGNVERYLAQFM